MFRTLALIAIILPLFCSAQNSNRWRNIGIEDGLSNLSINDLVQDSIGYFWLATNEGLNRYDGEFISKFPANDSLKIGQSPIIDLLIDDTFIWLAIKGRGLFRYHPDTDLIEEISALKNIDIYRLRLVQEELWISTPRSGLIRYNKVTNETFYQFGRQCNIIDAIPYGKDSMLCSLVGVGLFHLSIQNDTINAFDSKYKPLKRSSFEQSTFYTCHNLRLLNGTLWAGCWDNAIHEFNDQSFTSFLLPGEKELSYEGEEIKLLSTYENKIFAGAKSGKLYWFDPEQRNFTEILKEGFAGEELKSILIDKDQRLWVGTEQGVNFIETKKPLFEILKLKSVSNQTIKIHAIEKYEDSIFLGTNEGLYLYNGDTIIKLENKLEDQRIYSILSHEESLFIGTATTVYEMDMESQRLRDLFKSPLILPAKPIFIPGQLKYSRYTSLAIQESEFGKLLLASAYGYTLIIYHMEEDWHTFSLLDGELKESLYNDVFVDKKNILYLCGEQDGFFENVELYFPFCQSDEFFNRLDLKDKCQLEFPSLKSKESYTSLKNQEFISNSFTQVQVDSIGTPWVSTPSGLFVLGEKIKKKQFLFNEILSFDMKDNRIWSISNNGLQYVDESNVPLYYGFESGLPKSGLSGPIVINKGSLLLGGNGFLAKADLSDFRIDNKRNQHLYLSNIYTLKDKSKPGLIEDIYTIHESDNGLSLSVTVIDFIGAKENTFSYTIPELYDFWVDNGSNNEILLPGLKGGKYELVIKAKDRNGIQISEPISLFIKVKKPWYKLWWFKIFIGLFLISIGFGWIFNRQRQQKRVVKMREHISRDLHDDVGSLLGSISIYTAAAVNALQTGKPEQTKSILNKIGLHARTMIDNMNDIVWSINTDQDTLGDLFEKMEFFAVEVFQAKGILTHYKMDFELISKEVSMEKRKNIYLIFKEIIHNILKHSAAKEVWINMSKSEGKLLMSVKDNGSGFDLEKSYDSRGNGLKSMHKRAKEINASIEILSKDQEGTEILLRL